MNARKTCCAAVAALAGLALWGAPVKVIFDTDMIEDYDDIGALAVLHALEDAGECEILATVSCTRSNASVAAVEIVNAYYGRPEIPVGCAREKGVQGRPHDHNKFEMLVKKYPEWVGHANSDDAPDANEVYRKVLAAQPDQSVTICSVGFLTNLRRLLETGPDAHSPLSGRELVAKKVSKWVAMACSYKDGAEYNSMRDAESSAIALRDWPTPIVFTDFQYGHTVFTGRRVAELKAKDNPVTDVFKSSLMKLEDVTATSWDRVTGHPSWDETAVLVAVRGTEKYFGEEHGTYLMQEGSGNNRWIADANSKNFRLTEKMSKADVGAVIDELMCRPPKMRGRKTAFERTCEKPLESVKLTFVGADGWDVYNCSIPFAWNGVRYIFGRLEKHEVWTQSHIALFRETAKDVWTKEPAFAELELEDPYVQAVKGELIVGGTYINRDKDGKFLTYQGRFYRGKDPFSLVHFADGPDKMKDIRMTELPNGRIGVFSRPRGEEVRAKWGSEAVVGYAEIASLDEFNADLVQNAPIIPGLFGKDEWGGVNQAYALKDGRILLAAHLSCGGAPATNGIPRQIYMNASFVFDPKTFTATEPKIIATRCFYPANEPKVPSLDDCVFTSGFVFREDGNVDVYTGLCDADEARCTIPGAVLGACRCLLFRPLE